MKRLQGFIEILLWLLVIDLGLATGAALYESAILVPQLLPFSENAGYSWNADLAISSNIIRKFWMFCTLIPLTVIGGISLLTHFWSRIPFRLWWRAGIIATFTVLGISVIYLAPTMQKLISEPVPEALALETALCWRDVDRLLLFALIVAFILMIKSLSVFYRSNPQEFTQQQT